MKPVGIVAFGIISKEAMTDRAPLRRIATSSCPLVTAFAFHRSAAHAVLFYQPSLTGGAALRVAGAPFPLVTAPRTMLDAVEHHRPPFPAVVLLLQRAGR